MKLTAWMLILGAMLPAGAALAATPTPNASAINALNHRMHVMLQDVAHHNEQTEVTMEPDPSGLKTIVHVKVHPSFNNAYRADLTKNVNEYIDIHKGDCKTKVNPLAPIGTDYSLNPIHNGVSTTTLNVPISTLAGHGNVVSTHYGSSGATINCGSI